MTAQNNKQCPACGQAGRPAQAMTLESLLTSDARERLESAEGFRFCRTATCDVVYFRAPAERFVKSDLSVPVFQKETNADRLVCYCFDHTVASIQGEVANTGTSVVPDEIAAACRKGLERCDELNPQSVCCIGNVRTTIKQAQAAPALGAREEIASSANPPTVPKAGLLSAGGAVTAAVLSSACCWLPLLLIGLGGSAVGVGGVFDAYRPYFVVLSVGLLGAGFYYIYIRKPKCGPDGECEIPNVKVQRFNKVMLWVAAAFVTAFALFPNYSGALFGSDDVIQISGEP